MSDAKEGQEQIQLTGTKSPSGYDTTGSTGIDHQEHNQQSKTQQNPDYYIPKVYHEADEVCVSLLVLIYIIFIKIYFKTSLNIINEK
jgi:hypothetical protein